MNDLVAPIGARWQPARVSEIVALTPRIKSFFFDLDAPMEFLAGQHVDVRLVAPDGYRAMRSYSIASAPYNAQRIELAIERLDEGEVSPFFHEVVAPGDTIDLRGPLGGHFVWSPHETRPVLLVGGGSGVVPLVSMARERRHAGATTPMLLLASARTWNDVIFRDELIALGDRRDGFESVFAITREPAARAGDFARRIDGPMLRESIDRLPETPQLAYICGTNAFVDTAADAAIAAGIPAESIRTERYGV